MRSRSDAEIGVPWASSGKSCSASLSPLVALNVRHRGVAWKNGLVARLADGTREHADAAAMVLLQEEQYQDPLWWLTPKRRAQLEEELPKWLVEKYPHMRAVHPDEMYEEELRGETEMAVRARMEEFLGMD